MANVTDKVASIRNAVYGKDVRESIASGIEAINTESENTKERQNVIDSQEQTRIDAEKIRQTNETDRQNAETERQTTFIEHEEARQTAETARETNETNRVSTFDQIKLDFENMAHTDATMEVIQARGGKVDLNERITEIENSSGGGGGTNPYKLAQLPPYVIYATVEGQTKFEIPYLYFDKNTDVMIVDKDGLEYPESVYTITNPVSDSSGVTKGYITWSSGLSIGSFVKVRILKFIPVGAEGPVSGSILAVDSIPSDRIQGFSNLTQKSGTYDEIKTLITNSQLIPGAQYLITDYKTKYVQPGSNVLKEKAIERLVLTATSSNTFSEVCSSLDYPKDIIYYDFNKNLCEDNTTARNGFIVRRINEDRGIDFPCDWRTMTWARYKPNQTQYKKSGTMTNYAVWTSGPTVMGIIYKVGNDLYTPKGVLTPSSNTDPVAFSCIYEDITKGRMITDEYMGDGGIIGDYSADCYLMKSTEYDDVPTLVDDVYNIIGRPYKNGELPNITFNSGCNNISVGYNVKNIFFNDSCTNIEIGNECYNFRFGTYNGYMVIGDACYDIIFARACTYINIGCYCRTMYFGPYSQFIELLGQTYEVFMWSNCYDIHIPFNTGRLWFGSQCSFINCIGVLYSAVFGSNKENLLIKYMGDKNISSTTALESKNYITTIDVNANMDHYYSFLNASNVVAYVYIP